MVPAGLQTMDDLIRVIDDHLKTHGIRFDARVKIRVTLFERKVVRYVVQNISPVALLGGNLGFSQIEGGCRCMECYKGFF